MDNLSTPDNMSKNTHTKLFKLQLSGANGNKPMKKSIKISIIVIAIALLLLFVIDAWYTYRLDNNLFADVSHCEISYKNNFNQTADETLDTDYYEKIMLDKFSEKHENCKLKKIFVKEISDDTIIYEVKFSDYRIIDDRSPFLTNQYDITLKYEANNWYVYGMGMA